MLRVLAITVLAAIAPVVAYGSGYVEPEAADLGQARHAAESALGAVNAIKESSRFIEDLNREREALRNLGPLPRSGFNIPFAKSPGPLLEQVETAGNEIAQHGYGALGDGPSLFVMISLSMPEQQVKALIAEARQFGAIVAIRGITGDDFMGTVEHLRSLAGDNGDGVVIDPNLFRRFSVASVPTFIMALEPVTQCTDARCDIPAHTKATGSATIAYFLDLVARLGTQKEQETAKRILSL